MDKIFLSENDNIIIGNMDSISQIDYLKSLEDYLIEYRNSLNLGNNTFGIEIEYEGIDYTEVTDSISKYTGWKSVPEKGFDIGGEVVSPVLNDNPINWKDIKEVLNIINNIDGTLAEGGAHVHVGAHSIKDYDSFINFLLLYIVFEDVLYRFGYMDRLNARETIISAAAPLSIDLANDIEDIIDNRSIKSINKRYERFYGINFNNLSSLKSKKDKNTIEFRYANATFDPVLWQNNVNLCVKLINACHKDLDIDRLFYLMYRLRDTRFNYSGFAKLNIDSAIELSDIIFDNNLDKTNFLKQYIKDGSETVSSTTTVYSRKFTKVN
jgi:hypothetical protein